MFSICWAWKAGRQLNGREWHIIHGVQGVKLWRGHAGGPGGGAILARAGRLPRCRSQTAPTQHLCRLHPGLLPGIPLHTQTQTRLRFLAVLIPNLEDCSDNFDGTRLIKFFCFKKAKGCFTCNWKKSA